MLKLNSLFNIVCSFLLMLLMVASLEANQTIIKNVTILSAHEIETRTVQNVIIENDLIIAIGENLTANKGAVEIEGEGKFLIPGLIDSHVHLYHATGLKRGLTDNFDELYDEYMAQLPKSFLYFGYTSVVELNANNAANKKFTQAEQHPRLFHCGHGAVLDDGFMALDFSNEQFVKSFPYYLHAPENLSPTPNGEPKEKHNPENVVKQLAGSGAICLKLYYEEANWYPGGAPEFRLPSQSLITEVVKYAHQSNLTVLMHATTPDGHKMAVNSGVDIIAHGLWEWPEIDYRKSVDPDFVLETINLTAKSNIKLQPTMRTIRNTQELFKLERLAQKLLTHSLKPEFIEYLKGPAQKQRNKFLNMFGSMIVQGDSPKNVSNYLDNFTAQTKKRLGRYDQLGGKLLLGSDTSVGGFGWGTPPGLAGFWEMQDWHEAGISLKTIFASATLDNAMAFGLASQIGSIEVGKKADLLLLNENPLETISAYNSIVKVIVNGKVIERKSLSATE